MGLDVRRLAIPDVLIIRPTRHADARGYFTETYNRKALAEIGIDVPFVQDNHSHSTRAGTVRGLHYQAPPCAQAKLVRVVQGRILDIAVDIRRSSPTFGQWVAAEISAAMMAPFPRMRRMIMPAARPPRTPAPCGTPSPVRC